MASNFVGFFERYDTEIVERYVLQACRRRDRYDVLQAQMEKDSFDLKDFKFINSKLTERTFRCNATVVKMTNRAMAHYSNNFKGNPLSPGLVIDSSFFQNSTTLNYGWLIALPHSVIIMGRLVSDIKTTAQILGKIFDGVLDCYVGMDSKDQGKRDRLTSIRSLMSGLATLSRIGKYDIQSKTYYEETGRLSI